MTEKVIKQMNSVKILSFDSTKRIPSEKLMMLL
jgi:hypothetical protein